MRCPLDGGPTAAGWEGPLTAMRKTMLRHTSARLVLGGRVWDYRGAMPGVAEETYLAWMLGNRFTYLAASEAALETLPSRWT